MKNNSFSVKDLVIGTRNEYLKLYKCLLELKKLTITYDSKVKDFNYHLIKEEDCKEIICLCETRKNIATLINYLRRKLEKNSFNDKIGRLSTNIYDEYSIINKYYDIFVSYEKMPEYAKNILEILNSDFINLMNFGWHNDSHTKIGILPNGIFTMHNVFGHQINLNYLAKDDILTANCDKPYKIDEKLFDYVLNRKIPNELLSNYHNDLIINNLNIQKPFEFVSEIREKSIINLSIKEMDDKILLKQIKTKG